MEDPYKSKSHSTSDEAEPIVDLTQEMALSDQTKVQIIDLTDNIDENHNPPDNLQSEEGPLGIEPTTESPPSEIDLFSEDTIHRTVEQEVDDVFKDDGSKDDNSEEISEPNFSQPSAESLFDDLSDIAEQVDSVTDSFIASNDQTDEAVEIPSDSLKMNEDEISLAAAEIESVISDNAADDGDNDEIDDEIIELTDIVDPSALQIAAAENAEDDDAIELTDIVDPSELQIAAVENEEDDDIIELTDIVTPEELAESAATDISALETSEEKIIEKTIESDAIEVEHQEQDLKSSDIDEIIDYPAASSEPADLLDEMELVYETEPDQDHIVASGEFENDLFNDDAIAIDRDDELEPTDAISSEAPIPIGAIAIDGDHEPDSDSVIRLNDVLRHPQRQEEKLPIEQIKMGAEKDLTQQHISLEAEETANVLGLDLEKEAHDGDKKRLTEQEIEAAIERIIQAKYADTIEQLIANAVEKAVTREMETIKQAMMDGDDPLAG